MGTSKSGAASPPPPLVARPPNPPPPTPTPPSPCLPPPSTTLCPAGLKKVKPAHNRWRLCITSAHPIQGGGVEKFAQIFFVPPPPLSGSTPPKKLAPHVGIFFAKRQFLTVCYLNLHVIFTLADCMTLAHELLLR